MRYALIDESGRLYDPRGKILVFAVLVSRSLVGLDRIIPQVRDRIPSKGKRRKERLAEVKFSLAGNRTRRLVLEEIAKQKIEIYLLVVDKEGRRINDTSENYAILVSEILKEVLAESPKLEHIVIDRHFTFITQKERFNILLLESLERELFIEHLDSQQNPVISLADFVAGAIRCAHVHNDLSFREIINNLVAKEVSVTWRELKKEAVNL